MEEKRERDGNTIHRKRKEGKEKIMLTRLGVMLGKAGKVYLMCYVKCR